MNTGASYFHLPVRKLYRFWIWGLSLKYDLERQLHTRSATLTTKSLEAGFCSLLTFKSFWIKAWNLPYNASKVSLSNPGQLFEEPLQVKAVSKNPKMIDNFAKFGSSFPSSVLKTSTTDEMSFKGKQSASDSISTQSQDKDHCIDPRLLLHEGPQKKNPPQFRYYNHELELFFSNSRAGILILAYHTHHSILRVHHWSSAKATTGE